MALTEARAHNLVDTTKLWKEALPMQVEDAVFIAKNGGGILGHRTGAGKTVMAMLAWDMWPVSRTIIMGTQGSVYTWRRLLPYWTQTKPVILKGASDIDWPEFQKADCGVWLTTFATFREWMKLQKQPWRLPTVDLVIVDELHRILRSRKSQFFQQLKRLKTEHFEGMSATWASRGPQDVWPALHYMNRNTFPSFWKFVNTWCWVEDTTFGKEIYGVRNPDKLKAVLHARYYVARPIEGFPGLRRELVELDMSPKQAKWYQELDNEMVAELEGVTVIAPNSIAKLTRLRQLVGSPKCLDPEAEYGPAVSYIMEAVDDDPHTVIFSLFSRMLDVIEEGLKASGYPADKIFRLQGGCDADEIERVEKAWKESKGICLCTITFAQSFALDTCHVAYFLVWSWDPNDNIQAEGRLRRQDSELRSDVLCKYLMMTGTCDEDTKEVLNGKQITVNQFLLDHRRRAESVKEEE